MRKPSEYAAVNREGSSWCCVQYGGSEAHSTFFQRQRGDWEAATQSRDLMTSIRRFYSNAYTVHDICASAQYSACHSVPCSRSCCLASHAIASGSNVILSCCGTGLRQAGGHKSVSR